MTSANREQPPAGSTSDEGEPPDSAYAAAVPPPLPIWELFGQAIRRHGIRRVAEATGLSRPTVVSVAAQAPTLAMTLVLANSKRAALAELDRRLAEGTAAPATVDPKGGGWVR
jgi:hypothetical protein